MSPGPLLSHGLLQRGVLERPIVGLLHVATLLGLGVLALGSLWVQIDERLLRAVGGGLSRGPLWQLMQGALDFAGLALVVALSLLLLRRVALRPKHLARSRQITVLVTLLLLIATSGFLLEGLRISLELNQRQSLAFVGAAMAEALEPVAISRRLDWYSILWWLHGAVALAWIAALPWTRLRHAVSAPLHLLRAEPRPSPALPTPFLLADLIAAGQFDLRFGLETAEDLGSRQRLALAACTQCGRCEAVCPAFAVGSSLSPRSLIEGLRGSVALVGRDDGGGGSLFETRISEDALQACVLCGACSQACPVLIQPHELVAEMRRALVAQGRLDPKQQQTLANLARSGNPYGSPRHERDSLADALQVPTLAEAPDADLLYWVGCAGTYDPRVREIVRATTGLLAQAGLSCAILGSDEGCCGDPARRMGEEGRFQALATANLEAMRPAKGRRILTHCPHCMNVLRNAYPTFGEQLDVVHHSELLAELLAAGRITSSAEVKELTTLHDSCTLARFNAITQPPRDVLAGVPDLPVVEMERCGEQTACCGAGGAGYWSDSPHASAMTAVRLREARGTGAAVLATACPYCLRMHEDALTAEGSDSSLVVRDIAEILAGATAKGAPHGSPEDAPHDAPDGDRAHPIEEEIRCPT